MLIFNYDDADVAMHHTRDMSPKLDSEHFKMHIHEMHELYYFISGKGHYYVEGRGYRLSPGCVMMMRAGEAHCPHISSDHPYERISIHFSSDILNTFDPGHMMEKIIMQSHDRRNHYAPDAFNRKLVDLNLRSISLSGFPEDHGMSFKKMLILCNLYPVLCELCRCSNNYSKNDACVDTNSVSAATDYINAHLTENLTLGFLASMNHIDKSYLNTCFKRVTGSTVWEYIITKRLLMARQHIRNGVSVTEAALLSGWKDYSSFYRQYKARFGCTPVTDKTVR